MLTLEDARRLSHTNGNKTALIALSLVDPVRAFSQAIYILSPSALIIAQIAMNALLVAVVTN